MAGGDRPIRIGILDEGEGVDFGSIELFIDDVRVPFAEMTIDGDPHEVYVEYTRPGGFLAGSTVEVRLNACDNADPNNCAELTDYSFVVSDALVASTEGSIVPDGYWQGQPEKPLEIWNLPSGWSVRIFDTAGKLVRKVDNDNENSTWQWDFTNDYGRQVARGLYVVRVTDAGGQVKQSGRFLVQIDP